MSNYVKGALILKKYMLLLLCVMNSCGYVYWCPTANPPYDKQNFPAGTLPDISRMEDPNDIPAVIIFVEEQLVLIEYYFNRWKSPKVVWYDHRVFAMHIMAVFSYCEMFNKAVKHSPAMQAAPGAMGLTVEWATRLKGIIESRLSELQKDMPFVDITEQLEKWSKPIKI